MALLLSCKKDPITILPAPVEKKGIVYVGGQDNTFYDFNMPTCLKSPIVLIRKMQTKAYFRYLGIIAFIVRILLSKIKANKNNPIATTNALVLPSLNMRLLFSAVLGEA